MLKKEKEEMSSMVEFLRKENEELKNKLKNIHINGDSSYNYSIYIENQSLINKIQKALIEIDDSNQKMNILKKENEVLQYRIKHFEDLNKIEFRKSPRNLFSPINLIRIEKYK